MPGVTQDRPCVFQMQRVTNTAGSSGVVLGCLLHVVFKRSKNGIRYAIEYSTTLSTLLYIFMRRVVVVDLLLTLTSM